MYKNRQPGDKTTRQMEDELRVNRAMWKDTFRKGETYNTDMSVKVPHMEDDNKLIAEKLTKLRDVGKPSTVKVFHEDIYALLNILREEKFRNPDPLFVNAGNNNDPLPGIKKGSSGDEADLFRRSNYYMAVEEAMYPILEDEVLYSPTVVIFKDEKGKRLEKPVSIGVVNVPPLNRPSLISMPAKTGSGYEEAFESANDEERARKKIFAMFRTAIAYDHDTLIITNYGGGKLQNPLVKITGIFNEAISKYPVPYVFFAIKTNDKRAKDSDFLMFHSRIRR
jgi:hypothetical protein